MLFFQYGMMGGMMPDGSIVGPDGTMIPSDPSMMAGPVVKEIIHCKSCTLFPPNPNAPPPTTRERPPGCRTIFVGGLPENTTGKTCKLHFDLIYNMILETVSNFSTPGSGEFEVIHLAELVMSILCFRNGASLLLWHNLPQD
jgi:hypothetical protein